MADGETGFGMLVKVDAAANGTFSTIGKQKDVTGGGWSVDAIDASHNESPNAVRQKIPGMVENKPVTFEMQYALGGDGESVLRSIRGLVRTFRNYNRAGTFYAEYSGFVSDFDPATPTDDKSTSSVEITLADDMTIYAA
jgi:hypothetical protein